MTEIIPDKGHFELAWKQSEWAEEGPKLRNRTAKQLRARGYTVECRTEGFTDLARDTISMLKAHLPGNPKSPFGAHMSVIHRDSTIKI